MSVPFASPECRRRVPVVVGPSAGRDHATGVGAPIGFRIFPATDVSGSAFEVVLMGPITTG